MNSKPTLKSVAERAGLTANTVSLALRDSPLVLPETKARVRRAAAEVGYVHNALAGSLRSGQSHTVAIIVGDVSNLLFAQRIKKLESRLRVSGYQALIFNTDEDATLEARSVKTAISHRADGVILCPCQKSRESVELLEKYSVPYLLLGRKFQGLDCDSVVWNDAEGGYLATRHLISRGSRKIVFLNGPEHIYSAAERRLGYERAMREAGLETRTVNAEPVAGGVRAALDEIMFADGIFAFSDLMALEAASLIIEAGLKIPCDARLIGFDDVLSSVMLPFSLTSVAADRDTEADWASELITRRIEKPDSPHEARVIDVKIVKRDST